MPEVTPCPSCKELVTAATWCELCGTCVSCCGCELEPGELGELGLWWDDSDAEDEVYFWDRYN